MARHATYRRLFCADDGDEPSRVHVERDEAIVKSWLARQNRKAAVGPVDPRSRESLIPAESITEERTEAWNTYFRDNSIR